MTVYNGEKYINEQIDSFINQTLLPHEIIISDDCSTDKTLEILENYKNEKKINFRIFKNEKNLGFTKNFEKAILKSTGDIIFLADQDDIWYKNKIQTIIDKFNENQNIFLIIHDADLVNEKLEKSNLSLSSQIKSGFENTDIFITGALTSFNKKLMKYILPFPKNLIGHDGFMHFVAKNLGTRLVIKNKLQMIRRHSNNTSDWVASSLKKINRLDVIKKQFFSKRENNYNDRLEQVENVIKIFSEVKKENYYFSDDIFVKSLKNLTKEKFAL